MAKIKSGKLDLLRMINVQLLYEPVIKWTVILKFQSTKGMSYPFDRV
jgi:hypothetical protein